MLLAPKRSKKGKSTSLYKLLAGSSIASPKAGISGGERVKRAQKIFELTKKMGYPDALGLCAIVDADQTTHLLLPIDRRKLRKLLKERGVSVVGSHWQGNTLATVCGMYGLRVRRGGMRSLMQNTQHCRELFPEIADTPSESIKVKP